MVDLLFLWQLIVSGLDVIEHGSQFDSASLQKVVLYYVVFLMVDLGSAALAFAIERREKLTLLPWLVLQRFGYRQLMYYVVLKAGFAALFGPMVGWNKLDRKSTVSASTPLRLDRNAKAPTPHQSRPTAACMLFPPRTRSNA